MNYIINDIVYDKKGHNIVNDIQQTALLTSHFLVIISFRVVLI